MACGYNVHLEEQKGNESQQPVDNRLSKGRVQKYPAGDALSIKEPLSDVTKVIARLIFRLQNPGCGTTLRNRYCFEAQLADGDFFGRNFRRNNTKTHALMCQPSPDPF